MPFGVLMLIGLALSASPARAAGADSLFPDPIIAKGQGVLVRQSELDEAFISYKASMAARQRTIPESQRTAREAQLLDRLIVTQILIGRVTEPDRQRAQEVATEFLESAKKTATSDEMFERQLKAMGMTVEQYNARVLQQAMADTVIDRELKSKVVVTDDQVQELYDTGRDLLVRRMEAKLARMRLEGSVSPQNLDQAQEEIRRVKQENLDRLSEPERVRVSHIFLSTLDRTTDLELPNEQKLVKRKMIEKLQARARAGEDFQKLIDLYSEDRMVQESRGMYVLTRDARFVPAFKAAAFSLEPGQISDVVTSVLGYHVLKLHEKLPAKKIDFKEAYPRLKDFLAEQEVQARLPEYFVELKKSAGVEVLEAKYQLDLEGMEPLPPGS